MKKIVIISLFLLVFGFTGSAIAIPFSTTGDELIINYPQLDGKSPWASFTADFNTHTLTVKLDELGIAAANNGGVLTAVFWSSNITFNPISASGSGTWIGTPQTSIGQQWDYDTTLAAGVGFGANQGIGSVGDPGFDHGNFALSGVAVNGVRYGIVNGGFSGTQTPVFDGMITFTLSFDPLITSFDLDNVTFNYGSEINQVPIPEPTALLLLGSGLIGLWAFRRKLKK